MVLAPKQSNRSAEVPVESSPHIMTNQRLGLHYFPDTDHYRVHDLETWLPVFEKMRVDWLTLIAPNERAIPDYFIQGLTEAGIQLVLHLQLPTHSPIQSASYRLLFHSYKRWGVSSIAFFDRPNLRSNWQPADWARVDLVERFLDLFIPVAETAQEEGLVPVLPPLEPGGDYWDLSFLQSSLQGIVRRDRSRLLEKLALGAYAWVGHNPLDWGLGGPLRWPDARAYTTPKGSQDQQGFRIFDWYLEIAQRELGKRLPIYLLRAGALPAERLKTQSQHPDWNEHAAINLKAAELVSQTDFPADQRDAIPPEVEACCFWLLAAEAKSPYADQAWFRPDGHMLPVVNGFYRLAATRQLVRLHQSEIEPGNLTGETSPFQDGSSAEPLLQDDLQVNQAPMDEASVNRAQVEIQESKELDSGMVSMKVEPNWFDERLTKPAPVFAAAEDIREEVPSSVITHYVLLPLYAWGAADWDLSVIQPLLQESHPTVGFSLTEARLARRVTVVGGEGAISNETLEMLRDNGCIVERFLEDGTLVAS